MPPAELYRVDPNRDAERLRSFLVASDPDDYLLEDLAAWIHDGRHWVLREGDEWLAFGRLHDLGDGEGWLSGARVLPSRRGQGLGGQLLQAILADARQLGILALRGVIEDDNIASRRVFDRAGFRAVAPLALRRGRASDTPSELSLRRAAPEEGSLGGPVGWLPERTGRVDVLPGSDGGRFGRWRTSLVPRWAREGKLYVGPGLAVAVQEDWWRDPRTLWVNPLRGDLDDLVVALGALTRALGHEEWQAFFPSTDALRHEYEARGLLPHAAWGDRARLYERVEVP
jgi:GNAT superfamily N-acetyltransferase